MVGVEILNYPDVVVLGGYALVWRDLGSVKLSPLVIFIDVVFQIVLCLAIAITLRIVNAII